MINAHHRAFFLFFFSICIPPLVCAEQKIISAPIWIYFESVPGIITKSPDNQANTDSTPPVEELSELSRFIISGMLFGWKFSYTPSDKTRNVEEYFELIPIKTLSPADSRLTLENITADYPRLECWARVSLDEELATRLLYWNSITIKNAEGRGTGNRRDETDGIKNAYKEAVLHAVRSWARGQEKNKPKEIKGEVLLRDSPRLFADQGQFVADIRIRLNIQEMVPYTIF